MAMSVCIPMNMQDSISKRNYQRTFEMRRLNSSKPYMDKLSTEKDLALTRCPGFCSSNLKSDTYPLRKHLKSSERVAELPLTPPNETDLKVKEMVGPVATNFSNTMYSSSNSKEQEICDCMSPTTDSPFGIHARSLIFEADEVVMPSFDADEELRPFVFEANEELKSSVSKKQETGSSLKLDCDSNSGSLWRRKKFECKLTKLRRDDESMFGSVSSSWAEGNLLDKLRKYSQEDVEKKEDKWGFDFRNERPLSTQDHVDVKWEKC